MKLNTMPKTQVITRFYGVFVRKGDLVPTLDVVVFLSPIGIVESDDGNVARDVFNSKFG